MQPVEEDVIKMKKNYKIYKKDDNAELDTRLFEAYRDTILFQDDPTKKLAETPAKTPAETLAKTLAKEREGHLQKIRMEYLEDTARENTQMWLFGSKSLA